MENRRGSVQIIAALLIPVLIGVMGLVVDGVNLMRVHSQLQESVDAAALAVAVQLAGTREGSRPDVSNTVHNLITVNFHSDKGLDEENLVIADPEIAANEVKIDVTYKQKHFMMGFFDKPSSDVRVTANARIPGPVEQTPARIALVLDNSGSMQQGTRLADLETATRAFVTFFQDSPKTTIGFVPFAAYVNVGKSNRGASWLEVMPDGWSNQQEEVCTTHTPVIGTENCRDVEKRVATYPNKQRKTREVCTMVDGQEICRTETYWDWGEPVYVTRVEEVCDNIYGEPYERCRWVTRSNRYPWHGCVASRGDDESDLAIMGTHKFVGLTRTLCPSAITPLTNNTTDLLAAAGAMQARGDTFIPQGIEWARIMLNPAEPLPIHDREEKLNFMVVMSDGENTRSVNDYPNWFIPVVSLHAPFQWLDTERVGIHDHTSAPDAGLAADTIMIRRCAAAKADGVEIFTVALGIAEGTRGYETLKTCASKAENHFAFSDSSDLTTAFTAIAGEIAEAAMNVRLTK